MLAPSLNPYTKTVIRNRTEEGGIEYDGFLNGNYVGSFPREQLAWDELDRVALADARHSGALADTVTARTDDLPAANPLLPFGVDAGPTPHLAELTPAAIARAAEALADAYERHDAVVTRVLNAYDLALTALADQDSLAETRTVRVRENGDLTVRGSTTYWVSTQGCTCPDYRHLVYGQKYAGSGAEGGLCKHTLCREILRLAQARAGVCDATAGNKTAFTLVAAGPLARAISVLCNDHPTLTLELAFFRLRLRAGDRMRERISPACQGWGIRALAVTAADAVQLAAALSAHAKQQRDATVTLMLDAGEGEVAVYDGGFCRTIRADGWQ